MSGVVGPHGDDPRRERNRDAQRKEPESSAAEGDSPVRATRPASVMRFLSRAGHEEPCLNPGRPRSKAEYSAATDSEEVP